MFLYTSIQQDQKAKLDYHILYVIVVCVYGGQGGRRGLEVFKMFCQRGSEFFLLALCMCVCV